MNKYSKEQIGSNLKHKGVNKPCPRCNSYNFEVVGNTFLFLNDNPTSLNLGGPSVPSAIIACTQCGFITLHALGILNGETK